MIPRRHVCDRSADDLAAWRKEAHDGCRGYTFAGTTFSDERRCFSSKEVKRDLMGHRFGVVECNR